MICKALGMKGETPVKITVGDLFRVQCELPAQLALPSDIIFKVGDQDLYALKTIRVDSVSPSLDVIVTSYRPGQYPQDAIHLVADTPIEIEGLAYTVQSVIDPQKPPEKPFGPFGPLGLSLPPFYWWSLLGIFLFALLLTGYKIFRSRQRQRLIDGLKVHDSAIPAFVQAHQKMRRLRRTHAILNEQAVPIEEGLKTLVEIDEILKLYLTRRFLVPAFDWSLRAILSEFKRRNIVIEHSLKNDLRVLYREIKKMKKASAISSNDMSQLFFQTRKFIDKIEEAQPRGPA